MRIMQSERMASPLWPFVRAAIDRGSDGHGKPFARARL